MGNSKLDVAKLSCAELGTAQPQLVLIFFRLDLQINFICFDFQNFSIKMLMISGEYSYKILLDHH